MEESSKNKRGRPRTVPDDMVAEVLASGGAITPRGAVEQIIGAGALVTIKNAWSADPVNNAWAEFYIGKDGKGPHRRKSVMSALGRIDDEADLLATAKIIADRKMPVREAVAAIRRARGVSGGAKEG